MTMLLHNQHTKFLKLEFIKNNKFKNVEQFKLELFYYINWYNNILGLKRVAINWKRIIIKP